MNNYYPYDHSDFSDSSNWHNSLNTNNLPLRTNILRVTSLDEAIMKTAGVGSDVVYFDQSKDFFYRVKVDQYGNKSWKTFSFSFSDAVSDGPAMKSDINEILSRLEALEKNYHHPQMDESTKEVKVE